jgi:hypothetical protein
MGGGLMQLVAYGAQDVYLTGDPKVTFFKNIYKRHTSFATESIKLNLQGSIGNGNFIQVVLGRDGDLVNDMWVELQPVLSAPPVWLAERAFKSVELNIGGQRIDKHYQAWFRLWAEVFQAESKKLTYGKLTTLGNSTADSSAKNVVQLPLLFFFNKDPGFALPLIALQYHEVRIVFELADDYLTYFSPNYFTLWGNYVFLDTKEREMFAKKDHEYLIEQVQHNGGDVINSGLLNPSFRMTFQHPVKELIWCFQNPTITGSKMWNFCIDTANVYTGLAQTSNIAPHWYGSPILNVPSQVLSGNYDSGTTFTFTTQRQFGYSTSINSDGTVFIVGSPNSTGTATVYTYSNGSWDTGINLAPPSAIAPSGSQKYGSSVAISPDGTWAAIGAPDTSNGAIYCFKYSGNNNWIPLKTVSGSGTSGVKFGSSIVINNNGQVASGAPLKSTSTGEVYVYNINYSGNQDYTQVGVVQSGANTGDLFGTSIALDSTGTILAVGAPNTSGQGYVKVYRLILGTWTADTTPTIVGVSGDLFGTSISLNSTGNILAVGAPGTATAGYVKVFNYVAGAWALMGTAITTTNTSDRFGTSVSLNPAGTSLAVGSPSNGYVRVYNYSGSWPAYSGYSLAVTDATPNINFGQSVAISQNLVVGASALNNLATPVNYVKLYAPTKTSLAKTWVEQGGETATTTTGPLSSLNIDLNGQSRFFPQVGKYFNQYQPLKYHSGSPYPGIYCYSFALNPEMNQPSGTCNFSRIDNSQINIVLKSSMYTPCTLKLFAVSYNVLRFKSGMAGLAFSN